MKNFDERKAEIFLRSEKRIKERKLMKKKKWILTVEIMGAVAVLCVVTAFAFVETPSDKENSVSTGTEICQQSTEEVLDSDVQITIQQPTEYVPDNDAQTTIYLKNGNSYTFMSGSSVAVTMTDILENLQYDKNKVCKCMAEYNVKTESGGNYGINLTEKYARCDKGQAKLTQEQINKLEEIILWAKEKAGSHCMP